jgi:hypothetical protein
VGKAAAVDLSTGNLGKHFSIGDSNATAQDVVVVVELAYRER